MNSNATAKAAGRVQLACNIDDDTLALIDQTAVWLYQSGLAKRRLGRPLEGRVGRGEAIDYLASLARAKKIPKNFLE